MRSQMRHSIPLREPFRTVLSRGFSWSSYWASRTPSGLTLIPVSDTSIQVDWTDGAEAADGIHIYVDGVLVGTVDYGVGTYTIDGLTPDTEYTITVVAYSGTHESPEISDSATTFTTEYSDVYDSFTTKPDAARDAIYNTMVAALVAGGYWARMDLFRFYANHINTAGEALINWKIPGTFNATAFNAPTHTADQGFLFNGTTQYIDNNWVPSVSGVNFTQNSASQILYIRTNILSGGVHGVSSVGIAAFWTMPRTVGDLALARANVTGSVTGANNDGSGLFVLTRTAVNAWKLYRNSNPIITSVVASEGIPIHSPFTGAQSSGIGASSFRADQVAIEIWMDGCSQADVTAISDILNAAMTSLGTNVY